jgi:hypothetical protein
MFQPGTRQMCNAIDVGSGYWFSSEPILIGWIAPGGRRNPHHAVSPI